MDRGLAQRQAVAADAKITKRMVLRIGHQPEVRQLATVSKTLDSSLLKTEVRGEDVAGEQPEQFCALTTRVKREQARQGAHDATGCFQRSAKIGLLT